MSEHSGYFGPCKGSPLSRKEISELCTDDSVEVVWEGGNGPHVYTINNEMSPDELSRARATTCVSRLLEDARFVAKCAPQRATR